MSTASETRSSPLSSFLIRFAPLALLLLATRAEHFGTALNLPDASKAVFFLAGFYFAFGAVANWMRRAGFWGLIALAVAIDFIGFWLSGRETALCLSSSYPFLLPAYGVLWFGGRWLAGRLQSGAAQFALSAVAAWAVAGSLSYLLSNGAFYWLSGRYAEPNVAEYLARLSQYFVGFVTSPLLYLIAAAVLHLLFARLFSSMRNTEVSAQ